MACHILNACTLAHIAALVYMRRYSLLAKWQKVSVKLDAQEEKLEKKLKSVIERQEVNRRKRLAKVAQVEPVGELESDSD